MVTTKLCLIKPDDWHLHLRDGPALGTTVAHSAASFARAIVMPNLRPPVTTVALAHAYRARIMAAMAAMAGGVSSAQPAASAPLTSSAQPATSAPSVSSVSSAQPAKPNQTASSSSSFQPLMTLYLTDTTPEAELRAAAADENIIGVKYYPTGATTNAENGVTRLEQVYPLIGLMEELDLPLLMHGEVTDAQTDIFDRERRFIETALVPLRKHFPRLRMVLEHITTAEAAEFVQHAGPRMAATITVHHLLFNRNHMLAGGIRPHLYCLPVLKRDVHQQALIKAATSGLPCFFLGTDSAPHPSGHKESDCGCAGIYSAPAAIELYAQVFEAAGALTRLEAFASKHGADFYELPYNKEVIELARRPWQMPASFNFGANNADQADQAGRASNIDNNANSTGMAGHPATTEDSTRVVPIMAGQTIPWQLVTE